MKRITLFFTLFITSSVFSQKVALLKTDLTSPIIFTDSVTINQISQHYIPIEKKDYDTVYSILWHLRGFLDGNDIKRAKMKSFEMRAGSTTFKITTVPHAYGDCYDIDMITKVNEITSNYRLADGKKLNKKNSLKLEQFMNYMKSEKSVFNENYVEKELHMYNIEIYE